MRLPKNSRPVTVAQTVTEKQTFHPFPGLHVEPRTRAWAIALYDPTMSVCLSVFDTQHRQDSLCQRKYRHDNKPALSYFLIATAVSKSLQCIEAASIY